MVLKTGKRARSITWSSRIEDVVPPLSARGSMVAAQTTASASASGAPVVPLSTSGDMVAAHPISSSSASGAPVEPASASSDVDIVDDASTDVAAMALHEVVEGEHERVEPACGGGEEADTSTVDIAMSNDTESEARAYIENVAAWLASLADEVGSASSSLPILLENMFPMSDGTRRKILDKVPWDTGTSTYAGMLSQPKPLKMKGRVHVAMLNYSEHAFHGGGMYVGDAIMWLRHVELPMDLKRIDVQPCRVMSDQAYGGPGKDSAGPLASFGWAADGAMVNSTVIFALVALALYAVVKDCTIPPAIVESLSVIRTMFTRH